MSPPARIRANTSETPMSVPSCTVVCRRASQVVSRTGRKASIRRENRSSQRWVRAVAALMRTARSRLSSQTMAISSDSITLLCMLWLIRAPMASSTAVNSSRPPRASWTTWWRRRNRFNRAMTYTCPTAARMGSSMSTVKSVALDSASMREVASRRCWPRDWLSSREG